VLTHVVAVIGTEHDVGILGVPGRGQRLHHLAEQLVHGQVGLGALAEVAVD